MKVSHEVSTMPGSRRSNQDRWVVGRNVEDREKTSGVWDTEVEPLLTGVLDGVGGCVYSELASSAAANELSEIFYTPIGEDDDRSVKEKLEEACSKAEWWVADINRYSYVAATTLTAAVFAEDKLLLRATGDSPAYLYRDGNLTQLFQPQHDTDNSRLLLSCLGGGSPAEYEENELVLQKGDLIVLCTDGICCQSRLKWLLRLGVSASTIAKLSTMGKYSDNATILLAKVEEL